MFDLLLRAGRVYCPAAGLDEPGFVAVAEGRIRAAGPGVGPSARTVHEFPDCLLLPGLVDFHGHPACRGSRYGVDPDEFFLPQGTTTVLSQGDAGAASLAEYGETTVRAARTRVRLAINLSRRGEIGPGPCFAAREDADVSECVQAIRAARAAGVDWIWGIAVNTSLPSCGDTDPGEVLARALGAAAAVGMPLLVGLRRAADWPLEQQLPLLRPGDVVTYCFSDSPEPLVREGRVREVVWEARRRGVRFDLGHGFTSFDFGIAETAIAEGFLPDTLSTDGYARHVGQQPPHHLPRVLSKLLAAGMSEADAFRRVTLDPAAQLGLAGEVGCLGPGAVADLALLRWNPHAPPLSDCVGAVRSGGTWEPVLTLRAGEEIAPPQ